MGAPPSTPVTSGITSSSFRGCKDDVVPFKTTVTLVEQLMRLGKDFDVAFAPAATHGWSQRDYYAVYLLRKLVAHFDRYLRPGVESR